MLRAARMLLPLALLTPALGCEWLQKISFDKDKAAQTGGPVQDVSAGELVGYLNRQAGHLHAVRYQDVYIDVYAGKEHYTLGDSTLICARPRNFRLIGGKRVIGDVVDLGSNDREFWMYARFPDPTYVFCSHADFRSGQVQLPFPFDPDWALQALGMAEYDPTLPYRVDTDQRHGIHTLIWDTSTPQGPVRRAIVFDPRAGGNRSHVRQHLILDANNKPIATAEIKEAVILPTKDPNRLTRDEQVYVQVPTRVSLEWPQQQFKMDLKLRTPKLNETFDGGDSDKLFHKPAIDGVRPINLAQARFEPSSYRGATPRDERPRRR